MPEDDRFGDPYESTASWLQEVAQRRSPPRARVTPEASVAPVRGLTYARQLVWFGALSLASFHYYALDVMLTIYALPGVIVFVPV